MAIKGGKWQISDEEFEKQFSEATTRGKSEMESGVFATAARYDKVKRRLVVDLANGMTLLIPVRLLQSLQLAKAKELAEIEILGVGSGLYWPRLDVDIALAGLLSNIFRSNGEIAEASSKSKRAA